MSSDDIKVGLVRLDQIRFHPHNVRQDLGDLRALADSIASFGVMQPVVVENCGTHLRLRAGHRRVAAARLAGVKRIPAIIHDERLDDENWLVHSVQENVMRRQLDEAERNRAVQALIELGCSRDGIAEVFGVSRTRVEKWLNPGRKKTHSPAPVRRALLRSFADRWRAEAGRRPVALAEVLEDLRAVADTGRLTDKTPTGVAA